MNSYTRTTHLSLGTALCISLVGVGATIAAQVMSLLEAHAAQHGGCIVARYDHYIIALYRTPHAGYNALRGAITLQREFVLTNPQHVLTHGALSIAMHERELEVDGIEVNYYPMVTASLRMINDVGSGEIWIDENIYDEVRHTPVQDWVVDRQPVHLYPDEPAWTFYTLVTDASVADSI